MIMTTRHPLMQGIWLVLLAALAGGAAALLWSTQQADRYEAVGVVFVQPNGRLASGADVVDGLYPLDQSRLIPTYGDIASSDSVRTEAARRIGLDQPEQYRVAARMLPDSFALEVAATGPESDVAEALATEVIEIAGRRFTQAFRVYSVTDLSPARASRTDLGTVAATSVGLLAGAVAGGLLAVLLSPGLRRRQQPARSAAASRHQGVADSLVGLR